LNFQVIDLIIVLSTVDTLRSILDVATVFGGTQLIFIIVIHFWRFFFLAPSADFGFGFRHWGVISFCFEHT